MVDLCASISSTTFIMQKQQQLMPLTCLICIAFCFMQTSAAPPGLSLLYTDFYLDRTGYRYARPVVNNTEPVIMYMNLSLTQIMDVDEKNQNIKLNMWVLQEWTDPFFNWDPNKYGGARQMLLPSDGLWTPDIVLYSNTGGEWDLSQSATKLKVFHDGRVVWKPPVIYESSCDINVEFFPFDMQDCRLKMGTWSHNGFLIDLRHLAQRADDVRKRRNSFDNCESDINYAIDLSEYVENTEWDLMEVSATRNIVFYTCCPEPYLDITFLIRFRRQPLFYGTNLICPCMAISFLTVFVFYLPADSQEKITLSISILIALTVFILLVFDLTPPTSLVVPLITKYLLFTMILVSLSILVSTIVLNVRYRSPDVNKVPLWAKRLFMHTLPRAMFMDKGDPSNQQFTHHLKLFDETVGRGRPADDLREQMEQDEEDEEEECTASGCESSGADGLSARARRVTINDVSRAIRGVRSIARKIRADIEHENVEEEWKYIALVLDRLFLYCFGLSATVGTFGIFLQAPTLTDNEKPMRQELFRLYESNISVVRRCQDQQQEASAISLAL